ncbi:MAG: type II toxin-antitoxin system RelE/ParE family toxin [Singulisphaera sp.]
MKYTVVLAARAVSDLKLARQYIATSAPLTAERWYREFLEALLRLERNPHAYSLAPESRALGLELRQFFFRTKGALANRALYQIVGSEVHVLAIRRPGQPLITRADLS